MKLQTAACPNGAGCRPFSWHSNRGALHLSELGRQRFRRLRDKPASVVGYSRFGSAVNVVFDGNKSSTSLHASYLEPERENSK
jgi:hypothetical protein